MLLSLLIRFLVAIVATMGFAVLFNLPREELFYAGLTGAVGYLVYSIFTEYFVMSPVFSDVVASFVLIVIGRWMAVRRRCPVVAYLLVAIFPLVPGLGIYYTVYYLTNGPFYLGVNKGIETLECAAAIAFGIVLGSSFPQRWFARNVSEKTHMKE